MPSVLYRTLAHTFGLLPMFNLLGGILPAAGDTKL